MYTGKYEVVGCFMSDLPKKSGNRRSIVEGNTTRLVYYDTTIAKRENKVLSVTLGGYNTASTRATLNLIPDVHITYQQGVLMLNNEPWDGSWKQI